MGRVCRKLAYFILFVLRFYVKQIRNCNVVMLSDITTVVTTVTNLKASCPLLRSVAREVVVLILSVDARLRSIHHSVKALEESGHKVTTLQDKH